MRRRAFTLIELLVVISIIAVLAAVSMPAAQRARSQARTVACRSNLRQWAFATTAYANDHNGKVPGSWWVRWNGGTSLLESYMRDHKPVNLCPAATRHRQDSPWPTAATSRMPGGRILTEPLLSILPSRAAIHSTDGSKTGPSLAACRASIPSREDEVPLWRAYVAKCWRTLDVQGAYRVPLVVDSVSWTLTPCDTDSPPMVEGDVLLAAPEGLHEAWRDTIKNVCIDRHNAGVNMAFLDASTRKVDLKELWTLRWNTQYDTANVWTRVGGVLPEDWPAWMRKFKEY